jgi:Mrp family chromosome partitioning ATPase
MSRRRRSAPVLAQIPPRPQGSGGRGALNRRRLDAFAGLLEAIGAARVVVFAGRAERSDVATGLATAAVLAGRRAVLLECDLMRPSIASSLGLAEAPGLVEHLRGGAGAVEILQPLVLAGPATHSETGHLVCVVAGRPAPDAPALLASDAFREAMEGLRASYDLVVIEGPPDHSDSSLLSVSARSDLTVACCTAAEARRARRDGVSGVVVIG